MVDLFKTNPQITKNYTRIIQTILMINKLIRIKFIY